MPQKPMSSTDTSPRPAPDLNRRIIVRPAPEVITKSRQTRRWFQQAIVYSIRDAFARIGAPVRIHSNANRIVLRVADVDEAERVLPRIFGINSYSPVIAACAPDLDTIVRVGTATFIDAVRGRTYAVRAKRVGHVGFRSQDVNEALGTALNAVGEVRLKKPDVTVRLEIDGRECLMFAERRPGAGGLPAATQSKALVLVSGGFDSAVAAWQVIRRGVAVDFLFCNLGGAAYERMVLQVVKVLCEAWVFGQRPMLHVVDFAPVLAALRRDVRDDHRQIVLKRQMLRAASRVAAGIGAEALVTGECLGQVSSQTLSNLHAIEPASDLPLIRPLIASDKVDIVETARRIGTAVLSERIREYCAVSEGRPATSSSRDRVAEEEARIDPALVETAVAARKVIDISAVGAADLRAPYLFTTSIPDDAVLIDCQPAAMFRRWHAPGALNMEPDDLAARYQSLDKDRTYILYCAFGTQTPVLAEIMQQAGFEAYALPGGIAAVRRLIGDAA